MTKQYSNISTTIIAIGLHEFYLETVSKPNELNSN